MSSTNRPALHSTTTDSKRKRKLYIHELHDANLAATPNSGDCTLILTQGVSNKYVAMSGLSIVGQDYYGVFPLTGKLLNVRDASPEKNADFQNIMEILGLEHGKIYENAEELRYGHLVIMADQDHEGSRFKGLLINFLHLFWPSLLKVPNFLRTFIIPTVKAINKETKKVKPFYTIAEYEEWNEKLGKKAKKYNRKYYKGLPSFNNAEVKVYFADLDRHIKDFLWVDDEDGHAIELAFSKKKTEERKEWVRAFQPSAILDLKEKRIRYRDFLHLDFRQCLVADLKGSIPSMVDGLKPYQRSTLFCALKEPIIQTLDVHRLGVIVYGRSAYRHGEASLVDTIVGMAQNYVGSNNINLLQPDGPFGTRQMGGKDHGNSTHLFTQLSPVTRYLFHEDDELLLKYLNKDGRSFEPAWFIPIIPMVLVNGSEGSGTEWSSFIPNYNPQDIIYNLKRLLNGEKMVPMHPWYKGFNGIIQKTSSEDTQYTTTGIYEVVKDDNALSITELPVRRWTRDYKEFLEAASEDGKDKTPFIKAYTAGGCDDDETVHFEIFMTQEQMNTAEQEGFLKKFKLKTTLSTADMHLFDANGVIKKYDTPEQILKEFFDLRLEFYKDRKTTLLRERKKALSILENKVKFIDQHLQEKNWVFNRTIDDLKRNGFEPFPKETVHAPSVAGAGGEDPKTGYEYLLSIPFESMSYGTVQELQQEINAKKEEFDLLTKTPPKSLWLRDLTVLDHQLKEQDKIDDMIRKQANMKMILEEESEDGSDSDGEETEVDMIRSKQQDETRRNARKQEDKDLDHQQDGNCPSPESSPEIAAEDPKKNAPVKRAAASPLPDRASKKRLIE